MYGHEQRLWNTEQKLVYIHFIFIYQWSNLIAVFSIMIRLFFDHIKSRISNSPCVAIWAAWLVAWVYKTWYAEYHKMTLTLAMSIQLETYEMYFANYQFSIRCTLLLVIGHIVWTDSWLFVYFRLSDKFCLSLACNHQVKKKLSLILHYVGDNQVAICSLYQHNPPENPHIPTMQHGPTIQTGRLWGKRESW